MSEQTKVEATHMFPCPSCGGTTKFHPDTQTLSCQFCGNHTDIVHYNEEIREYALDAEAVENGKEWGAGAKKRVFHCNGCGAETVLDHLTTASSCAFCGSSHVVASDHTIGVCPESVVPFQISKIKASEEFQKWLGKRWMAPRNLRRMMKSQPMQGVYIPCWTYDANTYSYYSGEGGTYYYVTETYSVTVNGKSETRTRQVRKIRWWPTNGEYGESFDDVLVPASKQVTGKMLDKLQPFPLEQLVPYRPEYVTGFVAERYSVGIQEGWSRAQNIMAGQIEQGIIRQINADEVRNLRVVTSHNSITYKHLLLPLWMSAYQYKNKPYTYIVNGQTGEVQGESPISAWKVTLIIVSVLSLALLIFLFFSDQSATV
jgi:hypothetical protein